VKGEVGIWGAGGILATNVDIRRFKTKSSNAPISCLLLSCAESPILNPRRIIRASQDGEI
jgi:hypothetical protein